jgi:hypothetical protein
MSGDIEKRVDDLENLMQQVAEAVINLETYLFNVPRPPCQCPACRRDEEKITLQ